MLIVPPSIKIYLYNCITDMRKSFNSLSAIIIDNLEQNPLDGSMYVFYNKRKNKIKILHWEQNGCWLHYKCLAKGKFVIPKMTSNECIHSTELYCMLESAAHITSSTNKRLF
jgi:transposase